MKNNKSFSLILTGLILAFVTVVLPATTNAQGRYANTYSKNQVKGYIDRLERSSNTFRKDFDRAMDRSSLNGTPTEDRFNANVKDYENSLDRLKREFNRNNSWWDNRSNVQDMLGYARPVNQMMNSLPFARNLERQWRAMRDDINKVADTFDLPGINGGGWNGGGNDGGWNGGGNAGTPPNWAVGNWTWVNGTDNRQMTIDRNGRVTVYALGNTSYGTYNRNVISLDRVTLNVTRNGNGIRLQDPNTGEISNWRNDGGNGGGNDGGNTSTPPSWAQGTFYSTNIPGYTMTINRNGQITLVGPGQTSYGRWYQGSIFINNDEFPATRINNGLSALNRNTGQATIYSKR